MEYVGQYLKRNRISKKVSIEKISKDLKISIDFIKAIEKDDFKKTPGGVFTIGYIRSYANYLGLSANEIVSNYKIQTSYSKKDEDIVISKPIENLNIFNYFTDYRIVSIFLIFVISSSFYLLVINNNKINPNYAILPDTPESLDAKIEEIEYELILKEIEEEKVLMSNIFNYSDDGTDSENTKSEEYTSKLVASVPTEKVKKNIKNLILIQALDSTWIQLRDSEEKIIYNKLMKPDEEYSYSINDKYNITTGNAGNLIISINGIVKGKLGKKGEVVENLVITADLF